MLHLKGKRGLIMGVANERSIAWGIAKAMSDSGAQLAFTYQGENFGKRLKPCLLYTSPSPRDGLLSRMPSSA